MINFMNDNITLRISTIIKPYEDKIKELEESLRKKDLAIAVLKEKLYLNEQKLVNQNFCNFNIPNQNWMMDMNFGNDMNFWNNMMMNFNNNMPNLSFPIEKGEKIALNFRYNNKCYTEYFYMNDKFQYYI